MKITNRFGLPETIVNVLQRPTYSKGKAHLSVTELINSPRIVCLRKKHADDIEVDASEMVWSIFGTAVHKVLEHGAGDTHIVEERYHMNVGAYRISGAIDLQTYTDDGITITDWKTTSSWAVMQEKKEWEQQLNLYALLVDTHSTRIVTKLQIGAIIRDWKRREAERDPAYPQAPIQMIDIPLWSYEGRFEFARELIEAHAAAELAQEMGDSLPECSAQDMWERPTRWAIKKTGAARARSVHETAQEAEAKLAEYGKGYELEVRPGERVRCETYCSVSQWCDQFKRYKEQA